MWKIYFIRKNEYELSWNLTVLKKNNIKFIKLGQNCMKNKTNL